MARRKFNGVKNVDFSGVEGRVLLPDGEYHAKVAEISEEEGQEYPYLSWKFLTIDEDNPKLNNKPLYTNTSMAPQSLWNLRNLLETLGVEIPDGPMDLDFDELVDMELILVVEVEDYEGKDRSRVIDYMPVTEGDDDPVVDEDDEEDEEEVEEDEEEVETEEEEEELEPLTEDEISEMDLDELAEVVENYELDVNLKSHRTAAKKVAAVIKALEEAGYLAEED